MIFRLDRSINNKLLLLFPYGSEAIWHQEAQTLKYEKIQKET